MNEDRLFVHIIKRNETQFELAGLSEDKVLWLTLPEEYKGLEDHQVLFSNCTIKRAMLDIKPIDGYRKVEVKIDGKIRNEYFDEDDNLSYKNIPLGEVDTIEKTAEDLSKSGVNIFLLVKLKKLETKSITKEVNLHEIEKHFVLNNFDKMQNPADWLDQFESECCRHNVNNDKKAKIHTCKE